MSAIRADPTLTRFPLIFIVPSPTRKLAGPLQLFDVSADDILGLERKSKAKPIAVTPAVDRALARRSALLQSLPRRDRDAVTRTIDALITARGGPGRAA